MTLSPASSTCGIGSPRAAGTVYIRYMGNKRALARQVVDCAERVSPGLPLVDLFGGMCSVAGDAARSGRSVWVNDVQSYAALAAKCLVADSREPPLANRVDAALSKAYCENVEVLRRRFSAELAAEHRALSRGNHAELAALDQDWPHAANDSGRAAEVSSLSAAPATFPYRLATLTFACGYFGIGQAIELDSLRFAIDQAEATRSLDASQIRWARLGVLQAASMVAATSGHFAQFLHTAEPLAAHRVASFRRRSAKDAFSRALSRSRPFGSPAWRARNRVSKCDALSLWPELERRWPEPLLFYADPPYSRDHYSRYYHVLETLERYDYPHASGAGRYRADRFATPFSIASKVLAAMQKMLHQISERQGQILLSYPSSGLLTRRLGVDLEQVVADHFSHAETLIRQPARHSTLGARRGSPTINTIEYVIYGR
jgi:adenine-specific DNA-methyltransferase